MKKLLSVTILILLIILIIVPVYGQEISSTNLSTNFELPLENVFDAESRFTTAVVNIRKEPNTDSEILGTSLIGSSFDVVLEIDGWAKIVTEDGFAYMRTDWFVDSLDEIPSYDEEDLHILAMILCGEAHTYPDEEQRLVGSVFLNRVNNVQFPDAFEAVAADKRWGIQYACWWDGNARREITDRNWGNARWLLENGSVLPDYVLYQSGRKLGTVYKQTKYHYYCY